MNLRKPVCLILLIVLVLAACGSASGDSGLKAGNVISFGKYQNKTLDWQVLETDGNTALVILDGILCNRPYNEVRSKFLTWENSTLRRWLNNDFFNEAFSEEQRALIQTTHVDNSSAQHRDTNGPIASEPDTEDKVYLLSWKEVFVYYPTQESRICQKSHWWTRSPGEFPQAALAVASDGYMEYGNDSSSNENGIRPVMRIDLSDKKAYKRKR